MTDLRHMGRHRIQHKLCKITLLTREHQLRVLLVELLHLLLLLQNQKPKGLHALDAFTQKQHRNTNAKISPSCFQ
jgi:hypothetical protein